MVGSAVSDRRAYPQSARTIGPMIAGYALAGSAAALLAASALTARRPTAPVAGLDGYLDAWSVLHHGYDARANPWARRLLTLSFGVARPLARRGVAPDLLTLWGLWLAAAVVVAAQAGGRGPLLAGLLVAASGFADTVDGAVAAMTARATRWGYVLDSLVDRGSDLAYVVAVWMVGAPGGLAVACGVALGLLEYTRARAGAAGMAAIGVVTVAERPVRVICATGALLGAGLLVEHAALFATVGLGTLTGLSAVAFVQLLVAVRRSLTAPPPPT